MTTQIQKCLNGDHESGGIVAYFAFKVRFCIHCRQLFIGKDLNDDLTPRGVIVYPSEIWEMYSKYPIHRAKFWTHCDLCMGWIFPGTEIADGGPKQRAHLGCVKAVK